MPSVIGILTILVYVFFIAIMIRVVFSWIGPDMRNPLFRISYQVTEPVLAPVRNLLPQTAGIDLSPMIVTFLLFFLLQLLQRTG
jgi:YggT family protein